MARTYKYHVPDAYRGNGGRRPETKRATCSTDPMLDLTHPYFRAAIADFKRFEGIEKDKPLTRRQAKLFEYRVLTGAHPCCASKTGAGGSGGRGRGQ